MWLKCKQDKCSKFDFSEYHYLNAPINMDTVITTEKQYYKNIDRHTLLFHVINNSTLTWYYIFDADRDEDYNKIVSQSI